MSKKRIAQERNWTKLRVASFFLVSDSLTRDEQETMREIRDRVESLLKHWDKNTEEVLGHKLPPFKCSVCQRRSMKPYTFVGVNYCRKHHRGAIRAFNR